MPLTQAERVRETQPAENAGGFPPESAEEFAFFTRRRLLQTLAVVVVLLVAIYLFVPKLVGLEDALGKLGDASPGWLALALGFGLAMFATYITLFRGVVGGDTLVGG